jgi:hypothetical protein
MNQQTRNAQKYYSEHFWFLLNPVKIYYIILDKIGICQSFNNKSNIKPK